MSRSKTRTRSLGAIAIAIGLVAVGGVAAVVLTSTPGSSVGQWWSSPSEPDAAADGRSPPTAQTQLGAADEPDERPNAYPGEPGVVDVQHWDWLQQDLERLVERTRPRARAKRIGPDEFREEFVGATAEYLGLDETERERFEEAAEQSLAELGGAREDLDELQREVAWDEEDESSIAEHKAAWDEYGERQRLAVRHVLAALDERPRHSMLREDARKWTLRLDYGMRAAVRGPTASP